MNAGLMHGAERVLAQVSEQEWQRRVELAAAYRLVAQFGWDDLIFTHLSARVPGPQEHFLINEYGLLFSEITASNLLKVDLDGAVVEPTERRINPAGFTIHSAVHAARADAVCVIHLHTPSGIAVSSQRAGLLPLNQTAMTLTGQLGYHDYEGIAFDLGERPRLVADLGTKSAMFLRNHGTLAVGPSVAQAFLTIYFLERSCDIQVRTQSGGELHVPSVEVQEVVRRQVSASRGPNRIAELAWDALLRKLDREDPSYKT